MSKRKYLGLCLALLLLPGLSGCFKATTVVKVEPNGSGRIYETIAIKKSVVVMMMAMMGGFGGGGGEQSAPKMDDVLPLDQFKKKAPEYGVGVTYVTANRTEDKEFMRATAEYAFRDITKVTLSTTNEMTTPGASSKKPPKFIRFALTQSVATGTSELKIKLPPEDPTAAKPEGDDHPAPKATDAESKQMEEAVMDMMKDMEMTIAVDCGQEITSTNATYPEKNRVTLLYFSMGKLFENKDKFDALRNINPKPKSLEEVKGLLKGIEGIKFETQPEVTVKFK